jgi:RecG-like helicase
VGQIDERGSRRRARRGSIVTEMGLLDPFRRFFHRMSESDELRYAEEIERWSDSVADTVRIKDAPLRDRVRLAGVVRRITVRPLEGHESLEALLYDGTGEVTVVWMGRRTIPGLDLGTRVVVEGLIADQRGERRLVNPSFEFVR